MEKYIILANITVSIEDSSNGEKYEQVVTDVLLGIDDFKDSDAANKRGLELFKSIPDYKVINNIDEAVYKIYAIKLKDYKGR